MCLDYYHCQNSARQSSALSTKKSEVMQSLIFKSLNLKVYTLNKKKHKPLDKRLFVVYICAHKN